MIGTQEGNIQVIRTDYNTDRFKQLDPALWPSPHAKGSLELRTDVCPHAGFVGLAEVEQIVVPVKVEIRVRVLVVCDPRVAVPALDPAAVPSAHYASPEGDGAAFRSGSALGAGEDGRPIDCPHDHVHRSPVAISQLCRLAPPAHFPLIHVLEARRRQPHLVQLSNWILHLQSAAPSPLLRHSTNLLEPLPQLLCKASLRSTCLPPPESW